MQFPAFGRLYLLAALIVPVFSCTAPRDEGDTKQVQAGSASDELTASYKSFLGDTVFLFRDSEMYVGVQPIWEKDEGVQQAFVPTVKTKADVEVAECMHSVPPMDEYAGAIAFGRPPNKKYEGSFTCGNFRFDVQSCEAFDLKCNASYIAVFNIKSNRFVSYQLWDECRGIFLISDTDLVERAETWQYASYAVNGVGLFGRAPSKCLYASDFE